MLIALRVTAHSSLSAESAEPAFAGKAKRLNAELNNALPWRVTSTKETLTVLPFRARKQKSTIRVHVL